MKIVAVLVRYKLPLGASPAYVSITQSLPNWVTLFVYDNSPHPVSSEDLKAIPGSYTHDPNNGGVARAYNTGLALAKQTGAGWLLLLDQDTKLPIGFFDRLSRTLAVQGSDTEVVAVIPKVRSRSVIVSPAMVRFGWRLVAVPIEARGKLSGILTAINTGAAVRVDFLERLGGFNERFWLDYLDHWLFHKITETSNKVFLTDEVLAHDLSIQAISEQIDAPRLRNILDAEYLYFREFGTNFQKLIYPVRLIIRTLRLALKPATRLHAKITANHLFGKKTGQ